MAEWKDIIKPPFQNYDVVVYFGCGLFSLPFIHHYAIKPLSLRFPHFDFGIGIPFADTAVSTLSLLFTVYLIGHMIAYASSALIEKSIDKALGKVSSSVLICHLIPRSRREHAIQLWVAKRIAEAFRKGRRVLSAIRVMFLLPVLPGILISYWTSYLGYFRSRIPKDIFEAIRHKCKLNKYGRISLRTQWYKAIEHDIINNHSNATARMYNYLVISGTFRSLSFLFAMAAWAECYYLIHTILDGHMLVDTIMADHKSRLSSAINLVGYNVLFSFSVMAYLKFSRRYVEEALFAFVMAR